MIHIKSRMKIKKYGPNACTFLLNPTNISKINTGTKGIQIKIIVRTSPLNIIGRFCNVSLLRMEILCNSEVVGCLPNVLTIEYFEYIAKIKYSSIKTFATVKNNLKIILNFTCMQNRFLGNPLLNKGSH